MQPKKGVSLTTILAVIVVIVIGYYGYNLMTFPSRKTTEAKDKISTSVAPMIEKFKAQEGKTFKIVEIGKNYIKIRGRLFQKTITYDELSGPIPEGTTELIKIGGKYTPLIK